MSKPIALLRSCVAQCGSRWFSAHANELKVVAPNAVKEALVEVAARFEKDKAIPIW